MPTPIFKKCRQALLIAGFSLLTTTPFSTACANHSNWQQAHNIWSKLRQEFQIRFNPNRREIRQHILWFQHNQQYLYKTLEQAGPLINYVHQQTMNRDMPAELVLIPFIESKYHTVANSHAGAAGLWQFMPKTASVFGLHINWWYDDRLDVQKSTQSALSYLDYLNEFFEGDWLLAIAAYDSGEGTVLNAMHNNERCGRSTFFWHLSLPHETKRYIPRLLALVAIIRDPDYYGVTLPDIDNRPYFQDVEVPPHLPLCAIAGLAETDMPDLLDLNPEFKQGTTGPRTHTHVLLPIEKAALFRSNLAVNPTVFKRTWLYHTVLFGETLSGIAKKHKTTVAMLKKINHMQNNHLRQQQKLLVPNTHLAIAKHNLRYSYLVKPGDTLSAIAKKYHTTPKKLQAKNALSNDIIRPGTILITR